MYKCQICGKKFTTLIGISLHISKSHKEISKEEYYLKYVGMKGFCKTCGNPSSFRNIETGYAFYCSTTCVNKSSDHINNIKKTTKEKYGVDNVSQLKEIKERKFFEAL